jgi:hypothetical protein
MLRRRATSVWLRNAVGLALIAVGTFTAGVTTAVSATSCHSGWALLDAAAVQIARFSDSVPDLVIMGPPGTFSPEHYDRAMRSLRNWSSLPPQ